jgi:hypothetical protein
MNCVCSAIEIEKKAKIKKTESEYNYKFNIGQKVRFRNKPEKIGIIIYRLCDNTYGVSYYSDKQKDIINGWFEEIILEAVDDKIKISNS